MVGRRIGCFWVKGKGEIGGSGNRLVCGNLWDVILRSKDTLFLLAYACQDMIIFHYQTQNQIKAQRCL